MRQEQNSFEKVRGAGSKAAPLAKRFDRHVECVKHGALFAQIHASRKPLACRSDIANRLTRTERSGIVTQLGERAKGIAGNECDDGPTGIIAFPMACEAATGSWRRKDNVLSTRTLTCVWNNRDCFMCLGCSRRDGSHGKSRGNSAC